MAGIIEEIKNQPAHIREVFMWLCIVITFSVVSFFWFQSTAKEFVAMVNPVQAEQERALAQKNGQDQLSVLATIGQSASNFKASIAELLGFATGGSGNVLEFTGGQTYHSDPAPPQLFPISKNK